MKVISWNPILEQEKTKITKRSPIRFPFLAGQPLAVPRPPAPMPLQTRFNQTQDLAVTVH
jgi:hypothetical protein